MKIVDDKIEILRSAEFLETSAKIKTTSKSFAILSGIYSNIQKAVIRELSTNGMESHLARGIPNEPLDIHLPTALEPYFSVKDHGIGLSYDEIVNVFFTYFESTKDNTNLMVGCFGIGGKCPSAYTDSYSIVAIKDGIKNNCVIFLDEDRIPKITRIEEDFTDEDNGVEVIVPVKSEDFGLFRNLAVEIFRWFDTRPNFNIPLSIPEKPIFKDGWTTSGTGAHALMGNILYPIDLNRISRKNISSLGLILSFNLGELEPSPNREVLNYTARTIKALQDRIDAAFSELTAHIQAQFDACSCRYEALLLSLSIIPSHYSRSDFHYNNKPFGHYDDRLNIDGVLFNLSRHGNDNGKKSVNRINLRYDPPKLFVWPDMKVGNIVAAQRYGTKRAESIHLIEPKEGVTKQQILDSLGMTESYLINASTIYEKVPRVKGEKYEFLRFRERGYAKADWWEGGDKLDLTTPIKYVDLDHFDFICNGKGHSPNDLTTLIEELRHFNIINCDPVYGLRKCLQKKPNWINVSELAMTLLPKAYEKEERARDLWLLNSYRGLYGHIDTLTNLEDVNFREWCEKINMGRKISNTKSLELQRYQTCCRLLGIVPQEFSELQLELNKFYNKYPLLHTLKGYVRGNESLVSEYINLKHRESRRYVGAECLENF